MSRETAPAPVTDQPTITSDHIDVVPLRHPWRWVAAAAIALFAFWVVRVAVTTPAIEWDVVWSYLFDPTVLEGVRNTLIMTAAAMTLGVTVGTLIAIMRLSVNPILSGVAGFYQWLFRGVPTIVQLMFWFNLSSVFPRLELSIGDTNLFSSSLNDLMTPFLASLLGLGLNFAAYYSEIVRAGILSVDEGQSDAAAAYGLSRAQTMRYIVLPQAMRVIIPPTGNETIGMLKWTSIAIVISYSELMHSVQAIYNVTYEVIPLLMVAAIWYLFLTSILSIGQYFVEKRFARGTSRNQRTSFIATQWANFRGKVRSA